LSGSAPGDQQCQDQVELFQAVNFLLLMIAPEIAVGKQPLIVVPFHPLGDDKILPQTAHITPQVRSIEWPFRQFFKGLSSAKPCSPPNIF
jgi:hypothetical protein